jgi:hypothetical protein
MEKELEELMKETITVKQLIEQLKKVDENLLVYISNVGLATNDSWDAPLIFKNESVDVFNGKCRIHFTLTP